MLVIGGATEAKLSESDLARAAKPPATKASARDVMDHLVTALGAPRNLAYRIAHEGEE